MTTPSLNGAGSHWRLAAPTPPPAGEEDQGSSVAESAAVSQEGRPEGSEVAGWADISTAPRVQKGKTWEMRFWLPLPADHGAAGGASSAPAKATPDEHVPSPAGEVEPVDDLLIDKLEWLAFETGGIDNFSRNDDNGDLVTFSDAFREAASALTALQAENARLRAALEGR